MSDLWLNSVFDVETPVDESKAVSLLQPEFATSKRKTGAKRSSGFAVVAKEKGKMLRKKHLRKYTYNQVPT